MSSMSTGFKSFKKGIEEWPELYVWCLALTVGCSTMYYKCWREQKYKTYTARYKYGYHSEYIQDSLNHVH